jgi:hypothetical protein
MKISEKTEHPSAGSGAQKRDRLGILTGWPAACAVLLVFWLFMVASLRDKSLTFDEVVYAAAGYSQWHYGDFRLQPENGQLPERLAGLPLELSLSPLPPPDKEAWRDADQWQVGGQWLYRSGADAESLGADGRMACGLFAVALGALVWAWSRRLFGPFGGMTSLLLFVLNPTVLANGALMTSDTATALFFLGSVWGMWALLHRMTPGRLLLSALLLGALFLTKVSALLAGPIALVLIAARLIDGRPLPFSFGGFRRELASRSLQALAIACSVFVHALVVVSMIWACYGFRYSAAPVGSESARFRIPWEQLLAKPDPVASLQALGLSDPQKLQARSILMTRGAVEPVWSNNSLDAMQQIRREVLMPEQGRQLDAIMATPSQEFWVRAVELTRSHHILPEAWIYGLTDVYRRAQVRVAFMNGDFRLQGWRSFFPYTFLVKTPLALFGIVLLAIAAAGARGLRRGNPRPESLRERIYETVPLWTLLSVYWAAAIASHLDIGHRHLLPAYAPLFVLCGAAALWVEGLASRPGEGRRSATLSIDRAGALALRTLLVVSAVDTVRCFPNYIAYFNPIVRPGDAYRHLVDSSLDWGQDLPAVRAYVDRQPTGRGPTYFSYFGAASPDYYGIRAYSLYSANGMDWLKRPDWRTLFVDPKDVPVTLPKLREEWTDHDVLGMVRLGDTVAVTLLKKPARLRLAAGTYLVSASMLQPVNYDLNGPWGPWNEHYEAEYQKLSAEVKPLMSDDETVRRAAIVRHSVVDWPPLLLRFEEFRFGRLTAFLRQREPDEEINFSVLVYHLSEADLAKALDGPPAELGRQAGGEETSLTK